MKDQREILEMWKDPKMKETIRALWRVVQYPVTIAPESADRMSIDAKQVLTLNADSNHESYLIEDTANTSETVESSWSVVPYSQQVGEFKATVMVRNKSLNTIITTMSLLSFDYSELPNVVLQSDLITSGTITLTVGVNGSNKLYATVAGMTSYNKRIHICFERCVLSSRVSNISAESLFAAELEAVLTGLGEMEMAGSFGISIEAVLTAFGLQRASANFEASIVATMINHVALTDIKYGLLYNYPAVSYNVGGASIAPPGWHVPTADERDIMVAELGGVDVAGGKLKETGTVYWLSPNTGATNETGFSVRGGGFRDQAGGFSVQNRQAFFWTSTKWMIGDYDVGQIKAYRLMYDYVQFYLTALNPEVGASIRLIKNSGTATTMTDYDGNVYPCVTIGTQCWMAANLIVKHYNDGTDIPEVTNNTTWIGLITGAWCYYANNPDNE